MFLLHCITGIDENYASHCLPTWCRSVNKDKLQDVIDDSIDKCNSERVWRPRDATLSILCITTGSFQSHMHPRFPDFALYSVCNWETITW